MKEEYPYQMIYERDNFTCQYCGLNASKDFDTWWYANFNIDHIKPRRHGGTDDPSNLALSCHTCNLYKKDSLCHSLEEAREIIGKKRQQAEKWFTRHILKKKE